jgi:hypothetical protein
LAAMISAIESVTDSGYLAEDLPKKVAFYVEPLRGTPATIYSRKVAHIPESRLRQSCLRKATRP